MLKQFFLSVLVIGCDFSLYTKELPSETPVSNQCLAPTFTPDAELLDTVTYATQRWTSATNEWPPACPITVAEGSIPVIAQSYVFTGVIEDEIGKVFDSNPQLTRHQVCGVTDRDSYGAIQGIYVSTGEMRCDVESTTVHEIGHTLGKAQEHAPDGVMAANTPDRINTITEGTLNWVCETFECTGFNPEYY